ncbi:MAG: DUF4153 domain-containing protein [Bacteroidales bacterium]|nr:DUF4153 domain-containing protein [Bacteroidales bacterium]
MDIKKFFSPQNFTELVKDALQRFYVALIFFFLLYLTIEFNHYKLISSERIKFFTLFYFSSSAFLNFALFLWAEGCKSLKTKIITLVSVNIFWFVYSFVVSKDAFYQSQQIFIFPLMFALCTTILLSMFCLPFFRCKNDIPFVNFISKFIKSILVSVLIICILCGGISLLFYSVDQLFNLKLDDDFLVSILFFISINLTPILVFIQIPKKDQVIDDNVYDLDKISKVAIRYLFIPLLLIYLIVLYVYGLKILFSFELPKGMVSVLVSVSMFVMVLISVFIYGSKFLEGNKLDKLFLKYVPILLLPLLVLMSIGIFKRLYDYGITISRLYLLVVNIWFYAVCIYLIVTKVKRVIWIPASFCIIFILISFGPLSMVNITFRSLKNDIVSSLEKSNYQIPITKDQFEDWVKNIDSTEVDNISKFRYLVQEYPFDKYSEIVDSYVGYWDFDISSNEENNDKKIIVNDTNICGYYSNYDLNVNSKLNDKYSYFYRIDDEYIYYSDSEIIEDSLKMNITIPNQKEYQLFVERQKLIDYNENDSVSIILKTDFSLFVFYDYRLNIQADDLSSLIFSGYLFVK